MASCPTCGRTDWHSHDQVAVDSSPEVRSSQLLDEWEEIQGALQAQLNRLEEIGNRARDIQQSLAARGITVRSYLFEDDGQAAPSVSWQEDDGVEYERAPDPVPEAVQAALPTSRILKGVTPRRRPQAGAPKSPAVSEVEQVIRRIQKSDEAEEASIQAADRAGLPFQKPVEVDEDRATSAIVAEIRSRAVEDVADDSASLVGGIARSMELALKRPPQ